MPIIETKVNTSSEDYVTNYDYNKKLSGELFKILKKIEKMGPLKYIEKHTKRGKSTARERINLLKDKDTNFLEFSPLAGYELYEDSVPAGGIITGIIYVHGRICVIVANDATVKGGTYYPITVKKHLRAQEIAFENKLKADFSENLESSFCSSSNKSLYQLSTSEYP